MAVFFFKKNESRSLYGLVSYGWTCNRATRVVASPPQLHDRVKWATAASAHAACDPWRRSCRVARGRRRRRGLEEEVKRGRRRPRWRSGGGGGGARARRGMVWLVRIWLAAAAAVGGFPPHIWADILGLYCRRQKATNPCCVLLVWAFSRPNREPVFAHAEAHLIFCSP
jgi:hypothetical protein